MTLARAMAMFRILSRHRRAGPRWRRILWAGVGLSLLLHGMALDFWRGTVASGTAAGKDAQPIPLKARLHDGASVPLPAQPGVADLSRQGGVQVPSRRPVADEPAPDRARQALAETPAVDPVPLQHAVPGETGLRPLSPAEGLVAYRLALLAELRESPPDAAGGVRLVLTRMPDEAVGRWGVRAGSGEAAVDVAWLAAFRAAAERAALPAVLAGQAFELELEVVP